MSQLLDHVSASHTNKKLEEPFLTPVAKLLNVELLLSETISIKMDWPNFMFLPLSSHFPNIHAYTYYQNFCLGKLENLSSSFGILHAS